MAEHISFLALYSLVQRSSRNIINYPNYFVFTTGGIYQEKTDSILTESFLEMNILINQRFSC